MENNNNTINTVQPSVTAERQPAVQVLPKPEIRPVGYPADAVLPSNATADVPAPAQPDNRERPYLFLRRMNSVGNALLLDILLQTVAMVQIVIIALIVILLTKTAYVDSISSLMESDGSELLEMVMLSAIIANGVAMPLSHVLAGYMHSVRNDFTIGSVMGRPKWRGTGFWGATVLALGATYSWMFVCMILGWLMPESVFAGNTFSASSYEGAGTARMIATALYVCVGAPLTEEFLCRGVLLKSMSKYGIPFAAFASSLIFGLIHGNIYQSPFAFMVGLVLAYVAVRSGSIWPGVIIHFIVNVFATGRDLTMALVPDQYSDVVLYGFYGLAGLLVLGSVIILCTRGRRIRWQPIDADSNRLLLPEVKSRMRCKPLAMLLAVSLLIVILIYVVNIILTATVTQPALPDMESIMESYN